MMFNSVLQKNNGPDNQQSPYLRKLFSFSSLIPLKSYPILFCSSCRLFLMEDISHYIAPLNYPPLTLVHHPSHHLSIGPIKLLLQLFLSCDLPGNTVQRSTPYKRGHKSRYNAFNVVVVAFLQIFWGLPSFLYVREATLRGGNFVENYYNGPSKQLNRIQYIRGGLSPRKASRLFLTPKTLVGKSQQSSTSHSYLLGISGSRIRTRIQYLSIWTLASPRPSTHEFWTFAPTSLLFAFLPIF